MKFVHVSKLYLVLALGAFSVVGLGSPVVQAAQSPMEVYEEGVRLRIGGFFDQCDARYVHGQRPQEGEARIAAQEVLATLVADGDGSLLHFYAAELARNCAETAEPTNADWPAGSKNRYLYKAFLEEITHFAGWAKQSLIGFYGVDFALGIDKVDYISVLLQKLAVVEPRLAMKRKVDDAENRIEMMMENLNKTFAKIEEARGGGFRRGGFRTHAAGSTHDMPQYDDGADQDFHGSMVIHANKGAQIAVVFNDGSRGFARVEGGEFIFESGRKVPTAGMLTGVQHVSEEQFLALQRALREQQGTLNAQTATLRASQKRVPLLVTGAVGAVGAATLVMVCAEMLPALISDPALAGQIFETLCQDPRVLIFVSACTVGSMFLVKAKRLIFG